MKPAGQAGGWCSSAAAIRRSSPTSTPATRAPAGRRSASARCPTPRIRRSGSDLLAAGWAKVYQPGAAVLHAHDYGAIEFMRRYFDEYRGLRESTGHVEPFAPLPAARHVAGAVAADRRWMAQREMSAAERARWTARSATHHGGRRIFSALGSRAERVPAPLRRRLSLEGRDDEGSGGGGAGAAGGGARQQVDGPTVGAAAPSANGSAPSGVGGPRRR